MDKTKEYFRHDYSARQDEKIIRLIFNLGWEGYGLYWGLVELIYIGKGKVKNDYVLLAHELRTKPETIERIVLDYELFTVKDGQIRSKAITKRLEERAGISEKRSVSAMKRWDANAMQLHSKSNARIEQNRIEQNRGEEKAPPPSIEDVREYCKTAQLSVNPDKFHNYYSSIGWKKGNNPIVDWTAALNEWQATQHDKTPDKPQQSSKASFDSQERYNLEVDLKNKWHDEHTKDNKCVFCGEKVMPPYTCNCEEYIAEFRKYENELVESVK